MRFGLKIIIDIAYKMWYNLTQNKLAKQKTLNCLKMSIFKVGDTPVKVSFKKEGPSLQKCLVNMIVGHKTNGITSILCN